MPALWTVESMESRRREQNDSLVTAEGWSCSYCSGSYFGGSRLSLRRYAPGSYTEIVERDPRDGDLFETTEAAEAYALNAGRLRWYNDCKRAKAAQKEAI